MTTLKSIKLELSVSYGNSKLGRVPNLSTIPGQTCSASACKTCLKDGCYALKAWRQYENVRAAWTKNTVLIENDVDRVKELLCSYLDCKRQADFFRAYPAGDVQSAAAATIWTDTAGARPGTRFLQFTKQYKYVPAFDARPSNLSIIPSTWPGVPVPAALQAQGYKFAYVDDGTDAARSIIPANAFTCPGSCKDCKTCWYLYETAFAGVVFHKH